MWKKHNDVVHFEKNVKNVKNVKNTHSWTDGIWSIENLVELAQDYLGVVERGKEDSFLQGYGLDNYELAVPHHIGPFIISDDSIATSPQHKNGYCQLDTRYGTLPNFSHVALHSDSDKKDDARWVVHMCVKVHALPPFWAPTGPGYAYQANSRYYWPDNTTGSLAYFFTIDTDGRMYPCRYKSTSVRRVGRGRNAKWVHSSTWTVAPGWIKPQGRYMALVEATAIMINFGMTSDAHWNLRVERKTEKFSKHVLATNVVINQQLVKRLFKNRDKVPTVLTSRGKRRPILHWARAHIRNYRAKPKSSLQAFLWKLLPFLRPIVKTGGVRTHLKGVREFVLNGSRCVLTLPGYHTDTQLNSKLTKHILEGRRNVEMEGDEAILDQLVDELPNKDKYYARPQERSVKGAN